MLWTRSSSRGARTMGKAIWAYNDDTAYVDAVMKYAAVMRLEPFAYRGYYSRSASDRQGARCGVEAVRRFPPERREPL